MSVTSTKTLIDVYTFVLKELKHTKFDKANIWLHDFDAVCDRKEDKDLEVILRYGYPEAVTFWVMRKKYNYVPGISTLVYERAAFDNSMTKNKVIYKHNSRFIKVPYKSVRKLIELGIKQMLKEAQAEITELEKATQTWMKAVKKMPYDKRAALKIEFENNSFTVKALNPERITFEGFGSALRKIKIGEVSISPEAMIALERTPERDGLTGLAFDTAGGVNYTSQSFITSNIPVEDVSVPLLNFNKLKKLIIIE